MTMPRTLVMVRHAQSEANLVQAQFRKDADALPPNGFLERHDAHMRLSQFGREVQAPQTGKRLREEYPDGFDRYSVSPHIRTRETAGRLALGGSWRLDDRWRERDWGEYSALNRTEREQFYALSTRLKAMHPWYWCAPGGESNATGVRLRVEDILGTMHRELADKQAITVTHGETMSVARFVLENMDPDQWLGEDGSPAHKMENCLALEYSRMEPGDTTGVLAPQLRWRRAVCAWDPSKSWDGGEWIEIPRRRTYTDSELLSGVERFTNLFPATIEQATYSN